ncbi:MAG: hypothetical protein ABI794_07385 [Betaproteobacteria bacterium]
MAHDKNDSPADPVTGALGQALSAVTTSGTDLFARAIEIGGRQIANAIVQALQPAQSRESAPGRLDLLMTRYRDALGELALNVPAIAHRLSHGLDPVDGRRWMFRAWLDACRPAPSGPNPEVPAMPRLGQLEVLSRGGGSLFVTTNTLEYVAKAAREAQLPPDLSPLLGALPATLDDEQARDIPQLFDRLKYDFRRRGATALPDIRQALEWLVAPDLGPQLALTEVLLRTLGAHCSGEVLRKDALAQFATRLGAHPPRGNLDTEVEDELGAAFRFAGILLSRRLSVVARLDRWLVLDHETDRVFEIRRTLVDGTTLADVYGPAHCSYRAMIDDTRLLLPIRVLDAAHGMVAWSVDRRTVQETLNLYSGNVLKAWDMGGGKTPVVLFATEQREGDLGPYLELGLACIVAPRQDPLAVGMIVLDDILVTPGLGQRASNAIWGARKIAADLHFRRDERSATARVRDATGQLQIELTVPRGGDGTSVDVPLFLYTRKGEMLHRTVIRRSGSGESLRAGGRGVALTITEAGNSTRLGDNLRRLGIVDMGSGTLSLTPLFSAWSEYVTAQLPAPELVVTPEDED